MDKTNPIAELKRLGQSVWLDQIDRGMIRSGQLARYRDAGVSGVTANPTIIAEGANINVTLIFGIERYVKVVEAFLAGLEELRVRGGDLSHVHSVASFFVSRVDSKVDEQLTKKIEQANTGRRHQLESLLGTGAIANSKLAYVMSGQLHAGQRWDELRSAGASVQRPLWST